LTLPDPSVSVETAEAVRLFVERARAVRPDFRLTEANTPAVAEICRRLDGLPLAIELAAARVPILAVGQISQRLNDRFRLLANGSLTVLPRHRTLQALVDWSYDLLSERERILFRRLAAFADGWTLEAAEVVCSSHGIERAEVFDLLDALVAKSLVMVNQRLGETRFAMLETIRSYGLEKLHAAGEEQLVRPRHLTWILEFAQRAEPMFNTSEQREWLERLDRELANVRTALTWSVGPGEAEQGLRLATTIWRFWEHYGRIGEAREWVSALLAQPTAGRGAAAAMGLAVAGYIAYLQGDFAAAQSFVDEGLGIARDVGDPTTLFYTLMAQAYLLATQGSLDRAEACLGEANALAREVGWEVGVRMSLHNLGELAHARGDYDRAAAKLEEALAMSRAADDAYTQSYHLTSLAHLALARADVVRATECYKLALTLWRDLQDMHNVPMVLEGLGWAASVEGRAERATRLLGAAEGLREAVGATILPHLRAGHDRAQAATHTALGAQSYATAWAEGRAMALDEAIAYALEESPSAS